MCPSANRYANRANISPAFGDPIDRDTTNRKSPSSMAAAEGASTRTHSSALSGAGASGSRGASASTRSSSSTTSSSPFSSARWASAARVSSSGVGATPAKSRFRSLSGSR
jgi:hypothetical protein